MMGSGLRSAPGILHPALPWKPCQRQRESNPRRLEFGPRSRCSEAGHRAGRRGSSSLSCSLSCSRVQSLNPPLARVRRLPDAASQRLGTGPLSAYISPQLSDFRFNPDPVPQLEPPLPQPLDRLHPRLVQMQTLDQTNDPPVVLRTPATSHVMRSRRELSCDTARLSRAPGKITFVAHAAAAELTPAPHESEEEVHAAHKASGAFAGKSRSLTASAGNSTSFAIRIPQAIERARYNAKAGSPECGIRMANSRCQR
jgi:hypothetical protein